MSNKLLALSSVVALPLLLAAKGDGCAAGSASPAPDVTGAWDVSYDDTITVELTIGGTTYTEELGAQGGAITFEHDGQPLTFDLDCARPDVLCPSEAWPTQVVIEQREAAREHQMIVNLPRQACDGELTMPAAGTCGPGTGNPACDLVCDGDVTVESTEVFGVIGEAGDSFRLYLGGGIATNGVNCALLGWSVADATLTSTGSAAGGDWLAETMDDGLVTVGYAGGCLWAGDPDDDGTLEALALGAELRFTTGFVGARR
jgi:hypothetical protein